MSKYPILSLGPAESDSHIKGATPTYVTLCGVTGVISTIGHSSKVTCPKCIDIWMMVHTVKRADLAGNA